MSDRHDPDTTMEQLFALLDAAFADPAPEARSIVLAATAKRPIGQPSHRVAAIGAVEAYDRIHDALDALLAGLGPAEWQALVEPYGWSVRQLVAHLIEIDLYFAGCLGLAEYPIDPAAALDHVAMTLPVVTAWPLDTPSTLAEWRRSSGLVRAHLRSPDIDLRRRITFHMLDTRLETVLVTRLFELWTHLEDVYRSIGEPPPPVDPELLFRMTRIAVPALPLGLLLNGVDLGEHTVRFVLTGPGGGTFDQPTRRGQAPGPLELVVVADVTDFCRVAGRRLAPDALACEIEGDRDLALRVLQGAAAFAA